MDPATLRSAVLTGIRPLARNTNLYSFDLDAPIQFEAGQFVNLAIPGAAPRGERSYSMWNAPTAGGTRRLEFAIKLFAGGQASELLRAAPVGIILQLHGPYGHFVLRDDAPEQRRPEPADRSAGAHSPSTEPQPPEPAGRSPDAAPARSPSAAQWFLATTTGLAPFHSMLQGAARNRDPRPFRLLFGCREEQDVFALAELDALRDRLDFAYKVCLSRPSPDTAREPGRITAHMPAPDPAARYYLCGNGAMIADAREHLKAAGVDRKRIHYEKYW